MSSIIITAPNEKNAKARKSSPKGMYNASALTSTLTKQLLHAAKRR
jgi:hypothetical protein